MRILTLILLATGLSAAAPDDTENQAIIATIQRVFDAMAAHDSDAARAVMLPEGRVIASRANANPTNISQEQFAARLATAKQARLERMWNPKILVRGKIAQVWAEYDFHLDGKFTHCGIDAFSLVKTESGGKVSGVACTVETTGCGASPPGPPAITKQ
jgi:hypothetical protein